MPRRRDAGRAAVLLGLLALMPAAAAAAEPPPAIDYLYADANEGGASGGHAAIRFGDDGFFYAGGGIAWLHLPDVDAQTGYNVFLGLNSAAPWEKARGFLEGRWTRVSGNTAFQLVFGVLYRL